MLTPEDIVVIQKIGCYAFGMLVGFCFGYTVRPKPVPTPPLLDPDEDTCELISRRIKANIAWSKQTEQRPDVVH